jgi:hypothetical protein
MPMTGHLPGDADRRAGSHERAVGVHRLVTGPEVWAVVVAVAGWLGAVVLWLGCSVLGVPSFQLALGPLPLYAWVNEATPGNPGNGATFTFAASMQWGWGLAAVVIGALRAGWLQLSEHARRPSV